MRRIVLIGASGVFGGRLAAMIARWPDVVLVLTARRRPPLNALAETLRRKGARARIETAVLDRDAPGGLLALSPFAVIDAAGPFQGGDHRLARAALQAGAHVIDLADARDFVEAFPAALSADVARAGRWAITGASSTPALSHAALDRLTKDWTRIDSVSAAISPGARAPRGLSVIRAILSWAGRPMPVFTGGAWRSLAGWSRPRHLVFPGLGPRWASLAETPDLDLLHRRFQPREAAVFRAGLELSIPHLGLWALSLLRRARILQTLEPLAPLLGEAAGLLAPLGSDRGGMVVEAQGLGPDGLPRTARWGLWADAGAGPHTPAAPAAAVLRALLDDGLGPPRATACVGLVDLDAMLAPLADLPILTRTDFAAPAATGVFPRALGARFQALPATVRSAHSGDVTAHLTGWARGRGDGGLARLARAIQGLPERGRHDTRVSITPGKDGEAWTRQFGQRRFASHIARVERDPFAFEETVGPITFRFHAADCPGGFSWLFEGWRLGPVPLPAAWAPRVRARTFARDGVYRFRVLVAHRWTGIIFGYAGRLSPLDVASR